jgi:predicted transcriptional regulator of viral defense system
VNVATNLSRIEKGEAVFRKRGGVLRTNQALELGIHPRDLYGMVAEGHLERVARGVYRLAELPPLSTPDLAAVAARVPNGVICLISALSFHDMTTQIPHEVHLAVDRRSWSSPRIEYPPIRVYRYTGQAFTEGIEEHRIDEFTIRIYSPEKTVADCFKFRNKVGLDVALEALKFYRERRKLRVDKLLKYAQVCRVENVMRPYLEAVL